MSSHNLRRIELRNFLNSDADHPVNYYMNEQINKRQKYRKCLHAQIEFYATSISSKTSFEIYKGNFYTQIIDKFEWK